MMKLITSFLAFLSNPAVVDVGAKFHNEEIVSFENHTGGTIIDQVPQIKGVSTGTSHRHDIALDDILVGVVVQLLLQFFSACVQIHLLPVNDVFWLSIEL